jgi:hypothetical protein
MSHQTCSPSCFLSHWIRSKWCNLGHLNRYKSCSRILEILPKLSWFLSWFSIAETLYNSLLFLLFRLHQKKEELSSIVLDKRHKRITLLSLSVQAKWALFWWISLQSSLFLFGSSKEKNSLLLVWSLDESQILYIWTP